MRKTLNKPGFTFVEIVIVIVAIGAIGFFGWYLYGQVQDQSSDTTTEAMVEDQAPAVNDSDDLAGAEEFVNDTDIDSELDTSELDAAFEE